VALGEVRPEPLASRLARAPETPVWLTILGGMAVQDDDTPGGGHVVFGGASDGTVYAWDAAAALSSGSIGWPAAWRRAGAHQSGVNALASQRVAGGLVALVSGGDDDAIRVLVLRVGPGAVVRRWACMSSRLWCSSVSRISSVPVYRYSLAPTHPCTHPPAGPPGSPPPEPPPE
jgi:hypothetical protein